MDSMDESYSIVITVFTGLATVLNLLVLATNVAKVRSLSANSVMSLWLCLVDFFPAAFDVTFSIRALIVREIDTSRVRCFLHGFIYLSGSLFGLLVCLGLTILRYKIIVHKMKLTKKFVAGYVSGAAFLAATVAALPFLLQSADKSYALSPSRQYCIINWTGRDAPTLGVICVSVLVLLSVVFFIGFAYMQIYTYAVVIFQKTKIALAGHLEHMKEHEPISSPKVELVMEAFSLGGTNHQQRTNPRHVVTSGDNGKCKTEEDQKQLELLIQSSLIVSIFLVGWTPYLLLIAYEVLSGSYVSPMLDLLASTCVHVSQLMNPVILFIYNKEMRENTLIIVGVTPRSPSQDRSRT
ncbi:hypothetical protein BC830DRAFT_1166677 [Chytriomyces sp. MP71]|nr:hypothetical protein BC830DRAFT_1166677 [Chytriomyces sp. MP71]